MRNHGEDAGRGHEQAVTIGRGFRCKFSADDAAGTSTVVDDDLLAQRLGEPPHHRPRHNVHAGARGKRHHDAHRFRGISLAPSRNCGGGEQYAGD